MLTISYIKTCLERVSYNTITTHSLLSILSSNWLVNTLIMDPLSTATLHPYSTIACFYILLICTKALTTLVHHIISYLTHAKCGKKIRRTFISCSTVINGLFLSSTCSLTFSRSLVCLLVSFLLWQVIFLLLLQSFLFPLFFPFTFSLPFHSTWRFFLRFKYT